MSRFLGDLLCFVLLVLCVGTAIASAKGGVLWLFAVCCTGAAFCAAALADRMREL